MKHPVVASQLPNGNRLKNRPHAKYNDLMEPGIEKYFTNIVVHIGAKLEFDPANWHVRAGLQPN